jgi:hypothetical protein
MSGYRLDKAIETAERVMQRRSVVFNERDKELFKSIYEFTSNANF